MFQGRRLADCALGERGDQKLDSIGTGSCDPLRKQTTQIPGEIEGGDSRGGHGGEREIVVF